MGHPPKLAPNAVWGTYHTHSPTTSGATRSASKKVRRWRGFFGDSRMDTNGGTMRQGAWGINGPVKKPIDLERTFTLAGSPGFSRLGIREETEKVPVHHAARFHTRRIPTYRMLGSDFDFASEISGAVSPSASFPSNLPKLTPAVFPVCFNQTTCPPYSPPFISVFSWSTCYF